MIFEKKHGNHLKSHEIIKKLSPHEKTSKVVCKCENCWKNVKTFLSCKTNLVIASFFTSVLSFGDFVVNYSGFERKRPL